MKLRSFGLLAVVLATGLAACDSGRKAPPRTIVRVVDAAPSAVTLEFRREESGPATIGFRSSISRDYGEDTYNFTVSVPGGDGTLSGTTFRQHVVAGVTYTFVLTELAGTVYPAVVEILNLPEGSGVARLAAFHGAADLPAFDFYVAAPGAVLPAATPVASLAFGQVSSNFDLTPGDYRVYLTPQGDPNTVAFESSTFSVSSGGLATLTLVSDGEDTASTFSVLLTHTQTDTLFDVNAGSQVRVLNAAADGAPRDVIVNDTTVFGAVPFGEPTGYQPVDGGAFTVAVTPPGNPGVIEGEATIDPGGPLYETVFVTGETGALKVTGWRDNNRRFPNTSKIRFFNAASQFVGVQAYLLSPGTPVEIAFPLATLAVGDASVQSTIAPREYEFYVTEFGTTNVLFGPLSVTLEANGLYSLVVTNGADTETANIVLLDDFQ